MEAFIPAAGLGTRLRPLTNHKPKALVEVEGKTLLEMAIQRATALGATRVVVNVHHYADLVIDYIQQKHWETEVLISDERDLLLDTGGGLKKACSLFSGKEPVMIHNVDVIASFDYHALIDAHTHSNNLVTLAVSHRNTSRYLLMNTHKELKGWTNTKTKEILPISVDPNNLIPRAFSGISIVNPQLFQLLPSAVHPYPIIPEYIKLLSSHTIGCYEHPAHQWLDVGKPETLALAHQMFTLQ